MPTTWYCVLAKRQLFAGGDAQLPFDQIEPRYRLGDRVFHLQPRIHFHEIETVR